MASINYLALHGKALASARALHMCARGVRNNTPVRTSACVCNLFTSHAWRCVNRLASGEQVNLVIMMIFSEHFLLHLNRVKRQNFCWAVGGHLGGGAVNQFIYSNEVHAVKTNNV